MWIKSGKIKYGFVLFLVLGLQITLNAQNQPYVEVQLEKSQVNHNQPFRITFLLKGSDQKADFTPRWNPDHFTTHFEMMSPNFRRSITIINGKRTQIKESQYNYSYILQGSKIGIYQIQGPNFVVKGKNIPTGIFNLTVKGAEKNSWYSLELSQIPSSCYAGQRIDFTITMIPRQKIESLYIIFPIAEDKKVTLINSKQIDQNSYDIKINSDIFKAEIDKSNSETHLVIPLSILFNKTGTFSLSDIKCGFKGITADAKQDIFGQYSYEDLLIPLDNKVPAIKVKALPIMGRPKNFTGLIGNISVKVSANPLEVKTDDPISIQIEIGGYNDRGYELPKLSKIKEFSKQFKIPITRSPGSIKGNKKIFMQTIRALSPEVKQIPSIHFNYFNPSSGKYEEIKTASIPIKVQQAVIIDEDQVIYNSTAGRELAVEYQKKRQFHNLEVNQLNKIKSSLAQNIGLALLVIFIIGLILFYFLLRFSIIKKWKDKKLSDFQLQFTKNCHLLKMFTQQEEENELLLAWHNQLNSTTPKSKTIEELLVLLDCLLFSINKGERVQKSVILNELDEFYQAKIKGEKNEK